MLSFVSAEVTLCTAVTDAGFCDITEVVTLSDLKAVSEAAFVVSLFAVLQPLQPRSENFRSFLDG